MWKHEMRWSLGQLMHTNGEASLLVGWDSCQSMSRLTLKEVYDQSQRSKDVVDMQIL
jgi:hypothetical protein